MKELVFISPIMKIFLKVDFSAGSDDAALKDFCNLYNLKKLINKLVFY